MMSRALLQACRLVRLVAALAALTAAAASTAQSTSVEFLLSPSSKARHGVIAARLAGLTGGSGLDSIGGGAYRMKFASPQQADSAAVRLRDLEGVLRADRELAPPSGRAEAAVEYHTRMLSLTLADATRGASVVAELSAVTGTPLQLKRVGTGARAQVVLPRGTTAATLAAVAVAAEALPDVRQVERVRLLRHQTVPNDALWEQQWSLHAGVGGIRLTAAWGMSPTGGATVAVIDTGIRPHPDLDDKRLGGYDMISNTFISLDGDGRDPDATDAGDYDTELFCSSPFSFMSSWHGTHVSGIIAAATNNGQGIAGVSPESRLVPVRALGRCGGTWEDVADAIRWAAGAPVPGVPANPNPARVINMSLGGPGRCDGFMQSAVDAALARGAVIVAAAGNAAGPANDYAPANCLGVITVAATQLLGDLASYSNFGSPVTLSAPGGDGGTLPGILSTLNGGVTEPGVPSYASYMGTSMAAPHVSGVVALMLARDPSLTPAQVRNRLVEGARPFPAGSDCAAVPGACGQGLLDAPNALARVPVNRPSAEVASADRNLLVELRNVTTNRFVLLSDPVEVARYLADETAGRWQRTGFNIPTFSAIAPARTLAEPVGVCRAQLVGGSWSYSANTAECLEFRRRSEWRFDGYVWSAAMPDTVCPRGSRPAYEMQAIDAHGYNLRTLIDAGEIARLQADGWTGRRIAFCVPE